MCHLVFDSISEDIVLSVVYFLYHTYLSRFEWFDECLNSFLVRSACHTSHLLIYTTQASHRRPAIYKYKCLSTSKTYDYHFYTTGNTYNFFKPGKFKHHRWFKLSFLYHAKFLIQNIETTQSYTTPIWFKRFSAGKKLCAWIMTGIGKLPLGYKHHINV